MHALTTANLWLARVQIRWCEHRRVAELAGAEELPHSLDDLLKLLDATNATNAAIIQHHHMKGTAPALGGALPSSSTIDPEASAVLAADGASRVVEEVTDELARGLQLVGSLPADRLRARAFLRYRQASAVTTEWAVRHET